jgi:hypothetical protein
MELTVVNGLMGVNGEGKRGNKEHPGNPRGISSWRGSESTPAARDRAATISIGLLFSREFLPCGVCED